jgi:hypothetical protein
MTTAAAASNAPYSGHVARSILAGLSLLALAAGVIWTWTDGFSLWTAASRRTVAMYRGELRSPPLLAHDVEGRSEILWNSSLSQLAYLVRFVDLSGPPSCLQADPAFARLGETLDRNALGPRVRLVTVLLAPDWAKSSRTSTPAPDAGVGSRGSSLVSVQRAAAAAALRSALDLPTRHGDLCIDDIHLIDTLGRVRGLFSSNRWQAALQSATRLAGRSTESSPQ